MESRTSHLGKAQWLAIAFLIIVILAACAGESAATPPTSVPTATPAAETPTAAPATSISVISTPTPAQPSPTARPPSATPTATPLPSPTSATVATLPTQSLAVHFIDVGQGDATLLEGPDFTILIDAGRHDHNDVVPYLQSVGVDSLDLLVGTHPHADHIGQFDEVLEAFPVAEVWMSGDLNTTRTFERAIDAIEASEAGYHEPRSGEVFTFGSAILEVVNPDHLTGDFNEGSVSVRVVYGEVALMFTGDAEAPTEAAMVARGHKLQSQVLQLGHHGSRTSSVEVFIEAVQPEVAIYSAGEGNTYGHPHPEVIERLAERGIEVYGTDVNGTVIIETDGRSYSVHVERGTPVLGPPAVTPTATLTPEPVTGGCLEGQVDINTAPLEELMQIIHIGEARADELVELRPFASVEGMGRISGIGPGRLEDIIEQGLACVS